MIDQWSSRPFAGARSATPARNSTSCSTYADRAIRPVATSGASQRVSRTAPTRACRATRNQTTKTASTASKNSSKWVPLSGGIPSGRSRPTASTTADSTASQPAMELPAHRSSPQRRIAPSSAMPSSAKHRNVSSW